MEPPCLPGHTGRLLKALLGTSILFLLAHFVFQICLYTLPALLGPSSEYPWVPGGGSRASPRLLLPPLHGSPRGGDGGQDPTLLGAEGLLRPGGALGAVGRSPRGGLVPISTPLWFPADSSWEVLAQHIGVTR